MDRLGHTRSCGDERLYAELAQSGKEWRGVAWTIHVPALNVMVLMSL